MHVFIKEGLSSASKKTWDPKHLDQLAKETATQIKKEYAWRIKKRNADLLKKKEKKKTYEVDMMEVQDQFEEKRKKKIYGIFNS